MGCGSSEESTPSGSFAVSIPHYHKDSKDWSWKKVLLKTLTSPQQLKGEAAKIYFQPELLDASVRGEVFRPHLVKMSSKHWLPGDAASVLGLSLYYHMESLYNQDQSMGVAALISWPRKVAMDIVLGERDHKGNHHILHDTAHYFHNQDLLAFTSESQARIAYPLNGGIVGHELFHAYFEHLVLKAVWRDIEERFKVARSDVSFQSIDDESNGIHRLPPNVVANLWLLYAWNEGLADLRGEVYTRDPHYLPTSNPERLGPRSLDAPLRVWESPFQWQQALLSGDPRSTCSPMCRAYYQGNQIASLMLSLRRDSLHSTANNQMRYILLNLPRLAEAFLSQYHLRVIGLAEPLGILLNSESQQVLTSHCSELHALLAPSANDILESHCSFTQNTGGR
jgi:hypothetical protein